MKQILYIASALLLMGCNGRQDKAQNLQMDPDFEPTEPHPFAERIETETEEKLTTEDYRQHGDTIGTLVIKRAETDTDEYLLHTFSFSQDAGDTGTVNCQYNEFNELTDLWIETPQQRTHSMMQWDENGNLSSVTQESWTNDGDAEQSHKVQVIEYQYSRQSGYGNWFAGMAEQIGGPIAAVFYAGLTGRAPWMLPETITYVCSEIRDEMIGEQQTYQGHPSYQYDNNGRVISEILSMPNLSLSYRYSY